MDTGKLKSLATGARVQLMDGVRASLKRVLAPDSAESINERGRVEELRREAKDEDALVERVAYTWFNRLCALRLMDSRGYTPVPVVTPRAGETMPAILADARRGTFCADFPLKPAEQHRVMSLLSGGTDSVNPLGEAYVILLLSACDYYAKPIPALFGSDPRSANAMRLLAPSSLLAENSVLQRIVDGMDDENCKEVEVLGWLYQFYIAERKDEVFAGFKKNKKAGADEIKPATQLFTPHWIVRYMVENSLGRLWMLNFPDSELADRMDYYIAPEEPETDYLRIDSPEDITFLDPAMGSGHILVYAFDLLYDMYIEEGYRPAEIPALILQKNLTGFEIDDRAAEIAIFALMIKAREHDADFFEHATQPDVTVFHAIHFDTFELQDAGLISANSKLLDTLAHLDEIGSLYRPDPADVILLENATANLTEQSGLFAGHAIGNIEAAAKAVIQLSRTFSVTVANPPYMGNRNMNNWLTNWMSKNYPDTKSDLCTSFIERNFLYAKDKGYSALITMQSWMFLGSFEKLRTYILNHHSIATMAHLGTRAFSAIGGEVVSTTSTVFQRGNYCLRGYYLRLVEYGDELSKSDALLLSIRNNMNEKLFVVPLRSFMTIPGKPIAYWVGDSFVSMYENKPLSKYANVITGMTLGDNNKYLRLWWEISSSHIAINASKMSEIDLDTTKWIPYSKGGSHRNWYGNYDFVVDWSKHEYFNRAKTTLKQLYLREGLTWPFITSGNFSARVLPRGFLWDVAGSPIFFDREDIKLFALGYLCSSVVNYTLTVVNPTINTQAADIDKLPFYCPDDRQQIAAITAVVENNIDLAHLDWNNFETSVEFSAHPLLGHSSRLKDSAAYVESEWRSSFQQLKMNEEYLNRYFASVYGLEKTVPINVNDEDVSFHRFDCIREIKSLISYAIGCMFGRYSLDEDGLILADQGSTIEDYLAKIPSPSFMPDEDGILPITEEEWFEDDIVTEFWRWLKAAFGEENFEENLAYIEDTLGCKLREYFIKGKKSSFYDDHCKAYSVTGSGKRPIYWMFSSPKSSFNCLVYLHRYDDRTVSKILTDYVRELRRKLEVQARSLEASDIARDRTRAAKYHDMIDELNEWERDVLYPMAQRHIKIDLDDGVRHNYKLFPGALRKVTGLS